MYTYASVEDAWADLQTDGGPQFLRFISDFADTLAEKNHPLFKDASSRQTSEGSL